MTLPPVPNPLDPRIPRVDREGKPTAVYVNYEVQLAQFLKALKAALEAL